MRQSPVFSDGIIIMSRVRLARNLRWYPFRIRDEQDAREIVKKVDRAIVKCGTFDLYSMSSLYNEFSSKFIPFYPSSSINASLYLT